MSRGGWARERAKLFAEEAAAEPEPRRAGRRSRRFGRSARRRMPQRELVGRDLAEPPRRATRRFRLRLPIALGTIVAALLLVTLRVEILRLRYALAEVASEEQALLERSRRTTVRVRELRDPARLRRLATERGFGRPARVMSVELRGDASAPAAAAREGAR
jgi:hypothetical protein